MCYVKKKLTFLSILTLIIHYRPSYTQASYLDQLAVSFNTDKGSKWHGYAQIYEHYFEKIRFQPLKFLEIGFFKGSSARMWNKYFPNASLYFIDIDPQAFKLYGHELSDRCHLHVVDQSKSLALKNFAQSVGPEFDIIIDDGSHFMAHQITSFITLFPYIKPGGIYVIEDLHTSYWQIYGGGGTQDHPQASPNSAIRFFQSLVDHVNYIGARTQCANINNCPPTVLKTLNYYQAHIKSIHFYDSLCIILKR